LYRVALCPISPFRCVKMWLTWLFVAFYVCLLFARRTKWNKMAYHDNELVRSAFVDYTVNDGGLQYNNRPPTTIPCSQPRSVGFNERRRPRAPRVLHNSANSRTLYTTRIIHRYNFEDTTPPSNVMTSIYIYIYIYILFTNKPVLWLSIPILMKDERSFIKTRSAPFHEHIPTRRRTHTHTHTI